MVPNRRRISLARGGADLAVGNGRDPVLGEEPFSRVENERSGLSLSLRRTGLTRTGAAPAVGVLPPVQALDEVVLPTAPCYSAAISMGTAATASGSAIIRSWPVSMRQRRPAALADAIGSESLLYW